MSQLPLFEPIVWTVTNLTRYLRDIFDSDHNLQDAWVQGEISNLSRPTSGHIYFTIKDSTSSLRCVMWRNAAQRQVFIPRDGAEVQVHGSLSIYEAAGHYQMYADQIRPVGEGQFYQEFLRLKEKLEAEGLFAAERKSAIPRWPHLIGIVTSPTGAALHDILDTLRRRFPLAQVVISPTPVQGIEAPAGIIKALETLNRQANPDVILLARGGGSLEDLWAFNDESVARAISACTSPIISGIGHETDFTIADFVSDLRAPTPTAAAELATPSIDDLSMGLSDISSRLVRAAQMIINAERWNVNRQEKRLQSRSPITRLFTDRQRLDDLLHRTTVALAHFQELQHARLMGLEQRLKGLNPNQVLLRGFAILTSERGITIHSVDQVESGQQLTADLSDGQLDLVIRAKRKLES